MIEEEWDIIKHPEGIYPRNFICKLNNRGRWDRKNFKKAKGEYGKWIFTIEQRKDFNAPTNSDMKNFLSGLMEVEKRNDAFLFEDGMCREQQRDKKLNMFIKFMERIKEKEKENEEP